MLCTGFSLVAVSGGHSLAAVCGFLVVEASLVHMGSRAHRHGELCCIGLVALWHTGSSRPALAGRFLTTGRDEGSPKILNFIFEFVV